jgi:hypothetical protein
MKYIYTFLFIAISATSFAQGNLQYDSTITLGESITDSYSSSTTTNGPQSTVPDGKTWKIESMIFSDNFTVKINSMPFYGSYSNIDLRFPFPLWLKSGDTIQFIYNYSGPSGVPNGTGHYLMSALQFNIVP